MPRDTVLELRGREVRHHFGRVQVIAVPDDLDYGLLDVVVEPPHRRPCDRVGAGLQDRLVEAVEPDRRDVVRREVAQLNRFRGHVTRRANLAEMVGGSDYAMSGLPVQEHDRARGDGPPQRNSRVPVRRT